MSVKNKVKRCNKLIKELEEELETYKMLSEKRNIEIINNLKKYFQNNIDKGYSKFVYNESGSYMKNIEVLNVLDYILEKINHTEVYENTIEQYTEIYDENNGTYMIMKHIR